MGDTVALIAVIVFGLVALIGAYALLRQKLIVDDSGNVIEVEIPIFGKIKSNYPSVVAIFIAAALCAFIIDKLTFEPDKIPMVATVTVESEEENKKKMYSSPLFRYPI